MASAEFEQPELGRNLEQNHLIEIDPVELMKDNPAALIVNKEMYQTFERNFQPTMFQHPQVVRVRTYSPSHGMVIKLFVVVEKALLLQRCQFLSTQLLRNHQATCTF